MFLSIVIPAYNEENRLSLTLEKVYAYLKDKPYEYEVIVVDDGSADATRDIALQSTLQRSGKLAIFRNEGNKGKGFSVKRGILASRGEYVLFSDADLSTPIEEFDKLYSYVGEGFDVIIGSRSASGSDIKVHQPWHREKMGKIFNMFIKLFLFKEFRDTQCGFKLFKGDVAHRIAEQLRIDGFCFDVEMLYVAKLRNYNIKEIGVVWNNSAQSTVTIMRSSLNMFFDLFKIKTLHG